LSGLGIMRDGCCSSDRLYRQRPDRHSRHSPSALAVAPHPSIATGAVYLVGQRCLNPRHVVLCSNCSLQLPQAQMPLSLF
jgi:hypothetical protein